ncbi:hypothetical protein R1flu_012460 [Riccia fluitans]|uniref:Uncharacterized protein n=1 Tax=Riccia fluitans TaxID=41844 RepID=A0ABD1ZAW9_9MARC
MLWKDVEFHLLLATIEGKETKEEVDAQMAANNLLVNLKGAPKYEYCPGSTMGYVNPQVKPAFLMRKFLTTFLGPNITVLDFFSGDFNVSKFNLNPETGKPFEQEASVEEKSIKDELLNRYYGEAEEAKGKQERFEESMEPDVDTNPNAAEDELNQENATELATESSNYKREENRVAMNNGNKAMAIA